MRVPATNVRLAIFTLAAIAGIACSGCALPSTAFRESSSTVAADSSADHRRLLMAAWQDQVAFERFRLANLPRLYGPFTERQACRERLERFCLEPGDGAGAWRFVPEPPSIAAHRLELIAALAEIGSRIPEDDWVAGQRVRYAVEAGLLDEAYEAAHDCAGTQWWCAALAGYALHRGGDASAAEGAFRLALAEMPPEERRLWTDATPLLAPAYADSLLAISPPEQTDFAEKYWLLADPFLSRPGNEILSEHLSRRVEIQFQWAAGPVEGLPWGRDHEAMMVRYGLPEHRLRAMGALFSYMWKRFYLGPPTGVPDLLSHYTMVGADLLPPVEGLQPGAGKWDIAREWPRVGYTLRVGDAVPRWFSRLEHQIAVFYRGERAIVAAALDLGWAPLDPSTPNRASLALLPLDEPQLGPALSRSTFVGQPDPVLMAVEPRQALASLEVEVPGANTISRARKVLDVRSLMPGRPVISDLLLFDGNSEPPDSLEQALVRMRRSERVEVGEQVGLFWEIYGLDPDAVDVVSMSLRIIEQEGGVLRRIGRVLGITSDENQSSVRWQEEVPPGPWITRSIILTIPELPAGVHTIELTMEAAGVALAGARREIVIGERAVGEIGAAKVTRRPLLRRTLCGAPAELVVGNEGNLQAMEPFREFEALYDFWRDSWMDLPVEVPEGWDCFEWVRTQDEYFGHGTDPR